MSEEAISDENVNRMLMSEKIKRNEPYNLFFTIIPKSTETHDEVNSISFTDLLCPSLGQLKCSLQINFLVEITWFMRQYTIQEVDKTPITLLYGRGNNDMEEYLNECFPNVTHHLVNMEDPLGINHSKIGIYCYSDNSIRVVVSTANLYYEDWARFNQGLWISPVCPQLPQSSSEQDGAGPTDFKTSLLDYLNDYKLSCLEQWIDIVKRADFSAVKVFLVTSKPGKHYPRKSGCHIHRVGELLSQHCVLPTKTPDSEGPLSWSIIAQASSVGRYGKIVGNWLKRVLLQTLASHTQGPFPNNSNASISIIYPTYDNVFNSYYGTEGGGCLSYSEDVHEQQKWLHTYLKQWKADNTHRTRAMPHIKSYCRISPCETKLAWYLITSANISRSAWGSCSFVQKDSGIYVRSYEAGVLFIPKFFDEDYFHIANSGGDDKKLFPIMYDLPLVSYKPNDKPWCN